MIPIQLTSTPFIGKYRQSRVLNVPVRSLRRLDRKSQKVSVSLKKINPDELKSEGKFDFDRIDFLSGAAKMSYGFEGIDIVKNDNRGKCVLLLGDLKLKI